MPCLFWVGMICISCAIGLMYGSVAGFLTMGITLLIIWLLCAVVTLSE